MRRRTVSGCLVIFLLICVLAQTVAQDIDDLFAVAADALRTPAQAALESGTYTLRLSGRAYVPCVAPAITPFDEGEGTPPGGGASFASSDAQVVSVDEHGLMTGAGEGTAVVTCRIGEEAASYTVTVSPGAMPERVKAFLYVVNREFLANRLQPLPRANRYTKWYYGSNKEVGWCSVFTIWCANAAGINPIPEEETAEVSEDAVLFLREGQVGNQYDGFVNLGRFTGVPRPGYLVIYANRANAYLYTHIGIVTDVISLNDGLYQVTTVEGNMSGTVKRYTYVYDSNLSNHLLTAQTHTQVQANLFALPAENQTDPLTQYEPHVDTWTVFGFCATWR